MPKVDDTTGDVGGLLNDEVTAEGAKAPPNAGVADGAPETVEEEVGRVDPKTPPPVEEVVATVDVVDELPKPKPPKLPKL